MRALLFLSLGLCAAPAATLLDLTFSPGPYVANPGGSVTISGALQNNTASTVFINSNSFTFGIAGVGVVDDSPFLLNAPLSLAPLANSGTFDFFTVNIPALQALGPYQGVFTVIGGADGSSLDVIATASFEVDVQTIVPEPTSMVMLCGGLGVLAWRWRRSGLGR